MGHDVTVLTTDNGDRSLPRTEHRDGYTLVRHKEVARLIDNSIFPGVIKSLYERANDFDIIHAHSHLYFSTNLSALISKITDSNLVITNHGFYSQTASTSIQKVYNRTIGKATLNSADRIFCYTPRAKNILREHNIGSPIEIISNGINCEIFAPENEEDETQQILFVGRLKNGKRPDALIRGFGKLVDEYPNYQLKIVGDGPMLPDLKTLCNEKNIQEMVTFTGELSYDEMPDVYRQSDLLVLPTKTEAAIPRVVMEAWACKTPAIMPNIQEIDAEIFKKGGILCDGTPSGIYDSVRQLIEDDQLRSTLGNTGREVVQEKYSWAETVEKTTETYYEVVNE
ncbi:glycosyltransferase family 4 protein [Natronorubrum aibiense]|nr:glycosyltransferase family 4 protein [Natronorubrum aibiense]